MALSITDEVGKIQISLFRDSNLRLKIRLNMAEVEEIRQNQRIHAVLEMGTRYFFFITQPYSVGDQ